MDKRKRRRSRERSPDKKIVKGRGIRHESGLRSWNSDFNSLGKTKKIEEKTKEPAKPFNEWVKTEINQLETGSKKKNDKKTVWVHDKFDKFNRSPESVESEVTLQRNSPTYTP